MILTSPDNPSAAIDGFVDFLPAIETLPLESFHRQYHARLDDLVDRFARRPDAETLRGQLFDRTTEHMERGYMHARIRQKPRGYAGDFETIDWIYQQRRATAGVGRRWDDFGHGLMASKAVCSRKSYFISLIERLCRRTGGRFEVLNIGSGPCRDVAEAVERLGPRLEAARFHCVDNDEAAIEYARSLCSACEHRAELCFEHRNAFRLRTAGTYDLVWSAGLFDYLADRIAVRLAGRMWSWTAPRGSVVIGNFHPANETRRHMEWCLDWHLMHRDEQEMRRFMTAAGIPAKAIRFEHDDTGAVIFGIATKG